MPSAIVSAESAGTGSPRSSDSGYGAHAATWTPTTSTSGRADLTAIAMPLRQPAAADRDDDLREVGRRPRAARARASPGPATIVRVVERVHEREPALARALLRDGRGTRRRESPPRWTIAPCPRAASALAIGASAGTKTSQRIAARARPRRPAPGRGCPPTPRRRRARSPPSPERGELGRRAADLERAGALQVLGLQRDGAARALGDRAASRAPACAARRASTAGRAASTSSAVTLRTCVAMASVRQGEDRVDLDLRAARQRGDADTPRAPAGRARRTCRRPR